MDPQNQTSPFSGMAAVCVSTDRPFSTSRYIAQYQSQAPGITHPHYYAAHKNRRHTKRERLVFYPSTCCLQEPDPHSG